MGSPAQLPNGGVPSMDVQSMDNLSTGIQRSNNLTNEHAIHSFGRKFALGEFLNLLNGKMLPASTVVVQKFTNCTQLSHFQSSTTWTDSLLEKLAKLELDPHTKLSFLSQAAADSPPGLRFLSGTCASPSSKRIIIYCRLVNRNEKLNWKELFEKSGLTPDNQILTGFTHLVTGIEYGLESFLVLEIKATSQEQMEARFAKIKESVSKLNTGVSSLSFEFEAELEGNVTFTIYGDLILKKSPANLKEAFQLFNQIETLMKAAETAVPIFVTLTSLNQFCGRDQRDPPPIATDLVDSICSIFDRLEETKTYLHELSLSKACEVFGFLKQGLESAKNMINREISDIQEQIKAISRSSLIEEGLQEIVHNKGQLAYDGFSTQFIGNKKREIALFGSFINAFQNISVCQKESDMDFFINNVLYKRVLALFFNEKALSTQSLMFNSNNPCSSWIEDAAAVEQLKDKVRAFVEFFLMNERRSGLAFFVGFTHDGPLIKTVLFKDGVGSPVLVPQTPVGIEIEMITASYITFNWSYVHEQLQEDNLLWSLCHYRGLGDAASDSKWTEIKGGVSGGLTIDGLEPARSYQIKICLASSLGISQWSDIVTVTTLARNAVPSFNKSVLRRQAPFRRRAPAVPSNEKKGEMKTEQRFIDKLIAGNPILLEEGPPSTYAVPWGESLTESRLKVQQHKLPNSSVLTTAEKVILLVGSQGAGKQTLINAMLNYVFGVQLSDLVRFQIKQGPEENPEENSSWINIYNIEPALDSPLKYPLRIIDVPSFGDTDDISHDRNIISQLQNLFADDDSVAIDQINFIGVVIPSTMSRLTSTYLSIFDSLKLIFGKDINENILLLCTLADCREPLAVRAVDAAEIGNRGWLPFNNCALYADNHHPSDILQFYWQLDSSRISNLFQKLQETGPKSLLLPRELLKKRIRLEVSTSSLQLHIENRLSKLDELRQMRAILIENRKEASKNEGFNIQTHVAEIKRVDLPELAGCSITSAEGSCTVCPGSCAWQKHFNGPFMWQKQMRSKSRTVGYLMTKYEIPSVAGKKFNIKELIEKVTGRVDGICQDVATYIYTVSRNLVELDRMDGRDNCMKTTEYIDHMIENEQSLQNKYLPRIELLHDVRNKAVSIESEVNSQAVGVTVEPMAMADGRRTSPSFFESFRTPRITSQFYVP